MVLRGDFIVITLSITTNEIKLYYLSFKLFVFISPILLRPTFCIRQLANSIFEVFLLLLSVAFRENRCVTLQITPVRGNDIHCP